MKIVKQNDYILMETTVLGDVYSIVGKTSGSITPITSIQYCNKDVKKQRIILRTIKSQMKASGFIFEDIKVHHSKCLNCGTKISYEDAVVNNYKCCGALTILPEFVIIQNNMIFNVVIFDKKGAEQKIEAETPEPLVLWLTALTFDLNTFEIKSHVPPTQITITDISAEYYNHEGFSYAIGQSVDNQDGVFYYFGESDEMAIEEEKRFLLRVKYIVNQAKQKEWERFNELEKNIGERIKICNNK